MTLVVFDFETIPNPSLAPNADSMRPFLTPPSNYKYPDAIERWKDSQMQDIVGRMGLHPLTGRICAAGVITYDGTNLTRDVSVLEEPTDEAEAHLLNEFTDNIKDYKRIVTFNGKRFDVPFYRVRSRILKTNFVSISTNPYDSSTHIDLMNEIGSPMKLDEIRTWYGMSKATESLGDQVWRLWQEGKKDVIRDHCLDDIDATFKLAELLDFVKPGEPVNMEDFV